MSTAQLTAQQVMDGVAALLNDIARSTYTYAVQVPYLNIAMNELQEYFQLNAISVTEITSAEIDIPAGETEIVFDATAPTPELPDDFVAPKQLWERNADSNPYVPMTRVEYLPHNMQDIETSQLVWFVWQEQKIKFLPANVDIQIKIDYVRSLFAPVEDEDSDINIINAITFLQYRTAALIAEFVENNGADVDKLNSYASSAMDRATGIEIKGKQTIFARRRPFRSTYKRNGGGMY